MPTTHIEIEELSPKRWVAEVESGGVYARRKHIEADSFENIILATLDVYTEMQPKAVAPKPDVVTAALAEPSEPEPADDAPTDIPRRRGRPLLNR